MNILKLINRESALFDDDLKSFSVLLNSLVEDSSFLVIGGAGSIGQSVVREIFKRNPKLLHVVDISENNLVELVRDLRSSFGYIRGVFQTYALDCGSEEFRKFFNTGIKYDYVLNLSALKHVRSERDPFTLMRLINVNIFNVASTLNMAKNNGSLKYFCVSTDKAANPVNMMGASKRIMESFLMQASSDIQVSTARFANVAFSDGSLLHGFNQRLAKRQPITAPNDIWRYFVTPKESGELCLLSCLLGHNRDIFFPKLSAQLDLSTFADIACRYLGDLGYEAVSCSSEEDARNSVDELVAIKKWPCYFPCSDTTGEKEIEEFFTSEEILDLTRFKNIGVIKNGFDFDLSKLDYFENTIDSFKKNTVWEKEKLVELFQFMIPEFTHNEIGKNLDDKM